MQMKRVKNIVEPSHATCSLCQRDHLSLPILEGINAFCCAGCHAVFNILSAKNELQGFDSNPVFLQALKSGLISNPQLIQAIENQKRTLIGEERDRIYLEIKEMWCPSCAEIIKLIVMNVKGTTNCVVDYSTDFASIEFSPRYTSKEALIAVISSLGYSPQKADGKVSKAVSTSLYLRFAVAAFCSLNVMMLAYPLYATYFSYDGEGYGPLFAWISLIISLPVVFYSGWPIWRRLLNSIKTGILGMETLVFLGVASALSVSIFELIQGGTRVYFDTMTVIIVFVLLGKIIESRAKFSAKESLIRLTKATPRRVRRRFADGTIKFVPIKEIEAGHLLLAYAGERASLDGLVVEGEGACDESLMTGESMPIAKKTGDAILGGSIVVRGQIMYRATGKYEDSVLHKIMGMVEHDVGNKSTYIQAAESIVRWFVPVVLIIAAITAIFWWLFPPADDLHPGENALLSALAVLLISCPCAIGIAAPTAESYLMNGLASLGVIVRNRGCLRVFGNETMMIFDKTGTITEGRYKVQGGLENLSDESLSILACLASKSTHPVSCAIFNAVVEKVTSNLDVEDLEEVVGFGVKGKFKGRMYFLGSRRFMESYRIKLSFNNYQSSIFSTVYFADASSCLAQIHLGDQVRRDVKAVIQNMKPAKTILLSGDNESVVAMIAKQNGFDTWRSQCSPMEKRQFVDSLKKQGEIVCVIGDGINDAPALTLANVGVSVVNATDMSIQVSDLLMTTDKLSILSQARDLARKGRKIVKQNLFWAFFYNVIGIILAAFGVLSPIFAAFAMSISSLTVLLNARRLAKEL